jgi:hypothetical protein
LADANGKIREGVARERDTLAEERFQS